MPSPEPGETRAHFMHRCVPMVMEDGTADSSDQAVAVCMSMWRGKISGADMSDKAEVMKTESDGKHPASHYLIVEDPKEVTTWHLRVRSVNGDYDHGLCGAAWAALHEGYRGNRYEGPGKQEAITKLKRIYESQKWELPGKASIPDENKMLYSPPVKIEEIKAAGEDEWLVEGYVSTFGNIDLGNDVVMPGAFGDTLKSGQKVSFLLSHDPRMVLGVPKRMKEDGKGLFSSLKISRTQLGGDTRQLLLDGAIDSFSIGYKAVDWEIVDQDVRQLKKVNLYEVSLVPMPMNPEATVTRVKEYPTLAEKTAQLSQEMSQLLNDLRGLVGNIDRPLSETKRQELTELLGLCSGWDAVRSDLQSVLDTAPKFTRLVEQHRLKGRLAEIRKHYLQE